MDLNELGPVKSWHYNYYSFMEPFGHADCRSGSFFSIILIIIFGLNRQALRAQLTSPAVGRFDCLASDSNRLPWQPTNPQRFRPHFGIRQLLDQSESMGDSCQCLEFHSTFSSWFWYGLSFHSASMAFGMSSGILYTWTGSGKFDGKARYVLVHTRTWQYMTVREFYIYTRQYVLVHTGMYLKNDMWFSDPTRRRQKI